MTTILERLVDQLQRSAEGDAVHGPSVREVLEGVTVEDASAHPIAGAHSIRELVLHMAAGYHLVLRRLDGDGRQLSPEEDWPASTEPTEDAWQSGGRIASRAQPARARGRRDVSGHAPRRSARPGSAVFRVHAVHRAHPARPLPRGADHAAAPGPRGNRADSDVAPGAAVRRGSCRRACGFRRRYHMARDDCGPNGRAAPRSGDRRPGPGSWRRRLPHWPRSLGG